MMIALGNHGQTVFWLVTGLVWKGGWVPWLIA